ncbi:nuclear transport factor 2 family protein [Fodinicola acaciae]|uniref:nuclear transport factor 2 family protein n=1 Tax=Fodinicola acaciae TaxID=2681555 RepID=UPI003CCD0026
MIDTLDDIQAIAALKSRYCRTLDTKDWSGFRALFADDFVGDNTEAGGRVCDGADEFVAFVRKALAGRVTVHHVLQPEIELTSPVEALGIWAMQDLVRLLPGLTMHGFGHYHETYEKNVGKWLIKTSRLSRLREDLRTPVLTLFISDRIKRGLRLAVLRRT